MLTRMSVEHPYQPAPIQRYIRPGFVRVEMRDGVPNVWPIVRPVSTPQPNGAPHYLDFPYKPNVLVFGGMMPLRMTPPNVEMDPSNSATWQRPYRFT